MNVLYNFSDVVILPSAISPDAKSPNDISIYHNGIKIGKLPIFVVEDEPDLNAELYGSVVRSLGVGPMANYLFSENQDLFTELSCKEVDELLLTTKLTHKKNKNLRISIFPHSPIHFIESIKKLIKEYPGIELMVGMVSDIESYKLLSEAGVKYVVIGTESTTIEDAYKKCGIGYPDASLIRDVYHASLTIENPALIVANSSFTRISDMVKALALGADYLFATDKLLRMFSAAHWKENNFLKTITDFSNALANGIMYSGKTNLEDFISSSKVALITEGSKNI